MVDAVKVRLPESILELPSQRSAIASIEYKELATHNVKFDDDNCQGETLERSSIDLER